MADALRTLAGRLDEAFAQTDLAGRLRLLREALAGPIVFTTSFGIEDQALTHAIRSQDLDVEFATLDTGRMFPETYDVWARTEEKYQLRIKAFYPDADALQDLVADQGVNGFYYGLDMRKACCDVRKVEPLGRALAGAQGWIAGLRSDQSGHRAGLCFVEYDAARGLIKASPLLDFSRGQIAAFCATNEVPVSTLHERGFLSIGCAPCTRAIEPGEPERAGRWWWESEDRKECGLHVGADGRLRRAKELANS
ncbi:phosphoadenylyl-sulfate reductase [Rhodoblastus acidophilus]|uniref:Adenosine 5'-phosphosulfate reductase n=2 Tax=Candidatus Rhodoblastus alkanivorans TaxID=2954117 RepID=A0ABS9Z967_9HYPH|nr:phosphoadenylyl-sulfate reductase [Candidatus Rhodoblastus alkanivorans]MCI4678907.1 phosphoadenylyl-sulfate reductase [Candidatus Rhodoblastus alkanivorans]MCI4684169.1 phosphoadenylyl-sulfate reductase [Candidatus Rhodoblastus alkanivorans]MDI4641490.1 phosphoadenylyl-sulfate reductase [Rhodoblastus acidophilus]